MKSVATLPPKVKAVPDVNVVDVVVYDEADVFLYATAVVIVFLLLQVEYVNVT